MKKRLIASVASFALLFTTAFCGLSVPVHASGSNPDSLPEVIKDNTTFIRDPETGHIAMSEEYVKARKSSGTGNVAPNTASLPASYGSISDIKNKYPNTRNQNPYGTCWAHAAAACAEFDLVKNHGMPKASADFSELQLAYLNYHTSTELPGLNGDTVYIPSSAPKGYLDVGGNFFYSMHTLAQWKCFNYESSLPYSKVVSNKGYDPYLYNIYNWGFNSYHGAAQLRNVRMLDIKNDAAAVKQAIMNYGAVYISYCHESENYKASNGYGYYYNPYSDTTNHDVVIVGWDDNAYGPNWPSKGGWLVRNSWSTNQSSSSEYTYFYMSYYDKSLASTAYLADFEAYSSADNIYQHDGVNTFASIYVDGAANVYKANSYMDKASEKLDSVMLTFTRDENINYKIEVYTGLTSSDPTSGYLNEQATTTGWTTSKGIYTVQLNSPVYLSPGEKYSIVVTSLNGSHYFNIETSSEVTYNQDGYTNAWFTTQAYADQGESFYYNYGTWNDVIYYGYGYGNMCIKALTVDDATAKYTVNYVMDGGINNPANPVYFLSTQSGSADLQNPSRSGYHFLGWYTDPSYTNKVTSVNYSNKYNQTLYARWCADSNPHNTQVFSYATMDTNGSYQTSCSGCGTVISSGTSFMASSVKLDYNRLSYTGKNISPVPVITTSNGEVLTEGTDYTYKYNKSTRKNIGRYSVTVNFMGRYAGSKKIWFTVVPKAPGSASAKLHGYNDITVTWSKATGASGYYVYYKKASASTYKNYKRTTKRTLKFNNLSGNVKYNFKIVPYYKNGKTYYKSTKAKIVSSTTLKKLKQPNIYKVYNGRVSLDWASISGASGYQVWWSKSKSGKYSKLCDYSNKYTGVSFSVGKNQKYWYKTRAYKKVGKSKIYGPWSDPKAFTLR